MLLQLRTAREWPRAHLAAVLGVPEATLRKWEDGGRRPSGAAKKLIWLLHTILVKKERIPTDLHIAAWGQQWVFLDLEKLLKNDLPGNTPTAAALTETLNPITEPGTAN